ncbi:MAG TPA: LacI family DNA-binding transcriptional regulator [Candidatus Limnocylindria bacterium]|jgi:LacI family transcriptional regulator|nr:LacI family DNA-binding transcriptional regulator [Candidatus Limnocylindria bacterium]
MGSIVDVARLAGVSPATASRVLSGSSHAVSQATRSRVEAAAEELDFVPNALARGLLKSRAPIVGVIVHDITDPYFSEIVRGIEDQAEASGYLVITSSSDRIPAREESYVRLLRGMRAAAVLFAGSGIRDEAFEERVARHLTAMERYGAAVVHLSPSARGPALVGVDNVAAMAEVVRALAALGHRRIGYVGGPEWLYVAADRERGYRNALAEAGIEMEPQLLVRASFDQAGGADAAERLLRADPRLTAIACANDLQALGVLDRLAQLGVSVPDELSVTGFDDIPGASRTTPSLSTVHLPLRDLGRSGFQQAEKILAGRRPHRRLLAHELVLRRSTSKPRRAARVAAEMPTELVAP